MDFQHKSHREFIQAAVGLGPLLRRKKQLDLAEQTTEAILSVLEDHSTSSDVSESFLDDLPELTESHDSLGFIKK